VSKLQTVAPFGPSYVAGSRDGSDNLTITWERRSRAIVSPFDLNSSPVLEISENYEIDILDTGTVVRTIEVSAATTTTYTAAQQTTDGLTPGDPVDLEIYQMSDVVGRGNKTEATI
jgi:hypothetical protein